MEKIEWTTGQLRGKCRENWRFSLLLENHRPGHLVAQASIKQLESRQSHRNLESLSVGTSTGLTTPCPHVIRKHDGIGREIMVVMLVWEA